VNVVRADRTAEVRPVEVGVTEGDEVSISAGLAPGELVVVDGGDRLREGTPVELQVRRDTPAGRTGPP
jgi:multidrug efflux system membrane fusion protein